MTFFNALFAMARICDIMYKKVNGVVAVTFDIHFTTSGQSRRDGLGVHFNQLNYASAPYLRCQNCKGNLLRGIESSAFLGASSNGLAIVILIQSSFYPLPSTNGFSVLLIQSSLPSLHPTNEVTEKFVERYSNIKFLQGYGLTETAAIVASMFTKEETERYGSSGLLAPNMDGKIVDPDTGRVLGVHRTGELWLRSPTVMKCDWFFSKRCFCFWYETTGDLCYIDGEGFVFVVDRLKEFIKCNGYQVAPAELEALLFAHPEIADASKSLSKLNIDFAQPQVYSKLLRPSFVTVRAMSESQTALKNQPQSSASSEKQLDGRVKSLHPNIHGGILARRDVEHHMEALNEHGISTFDGNLLWNRTIPPPSPIRPERLDVSDNPTAKQTPCLLCCTQRSVLSYTASTSPSYW
ncbi:hypothetical protein Bca52824_074178 [Brassica carinata]|uniref:AMP-dependent synthetase/ligase domain-containing protein n=1 Tax=Brassica carinata TaxID=52824 RepID=A0A8X7QGM2_BRACI|nr:hypothetical protein Bca52824_074178 [Brassica carinata]